MGLFRVKIANHVIEIDSIYERAKNISKRFITEEKPDIRIKITVDDIIRERIIQGLVENSVFPDDQVEVLNILRKLSELLIDDDIILFHGSAISVDDNAYIFTANSGIGKTVHTIRWLLNHKDTVIINGDKPFIDLKNRPMVCGTPWSGKEGRHKNIIVPLKSIILMERANENHIEHISFAQAFPFLLQQVYRPEDKDKMRKTMKLLQRLHPIVSFYRFQCNNYKDDCFSVAYNALVCDNK